MKASVPGAAARTWISYNATTPIETISGPKGANAVSIASDASGNLYVGGRTSDPSTDAIWTVRKTSAGGATTSSDSYILSGGLYNRVSLVRIDASGNIYAVGEAGGTTDLAGTHGITRKSSDGGTTWTTIDDFTYGGGSGTQFQTIAFGTNGSIFVTGQAIDAGGAKRWFTRYSGDGGISWSIVDDYALVPGNDASPSKSATSASGVLYVAGNANDVSGVTHWIVRKLTVLCQ
jgi:hypothetical protein